MSFDKDHNVICDVCSKKFEEESEETWFSIQDLINILGWEDVCGECILFLKQFRRPLPEDN